AAAAAAVVVAVVARAGAGFGLVGAPVLLAPRAGAQREREREREREPASASHRQSLTANGAQGSLSSTNRTSRCTRPSSSMGMLQATVRPVVLRGPGRLQRVPLAIADWVRVGSSLRGRGQLLPLQRRARSSRW